MEPHEAFGSSAASGVVASATMSAVTSPAMMRLPSGLRLTTEGSSQRKSTSSSGRESVTPDSRRQRTTSSAPSTPMMPSKRPPDSTVSVCEPSMRTGPLPSQRRPMRLPAASTRVSSPASRKRSASQTSRLVVRREPQARVGQVGVGELRDSLEVGVDAVAIDVEGRQVIGHVGSPFSGGVLPRATPPCPERRRVPRDVVVLRETFCSETFHSCDPASVRGPYTVQRTRSLRDRERGACLGINMDGQDGGIRVGATERAPTGDAPTGD